MSGFHHYSAVALFYNTLISFHSNHFVHQEIIDNRKWNELTIAASPFVQVLFTGRTR
jgi:hypothetical protein